MTDLAALDREARPRDFAARYRRSRARGIGRTRQRRWRGRRALLLAAAVSLPAFAQPQDWERFNIGDAGEQVLELDPMPFEQAGKSFPGSAFYYLSDEDEPRTPGFGEGIRSDAAIASPREDALAGPAARAMRVDNSGVDRSRALECLTAAIYYEAASEPDSGQRAVAQVVLNRVAHPSYPSTVCGVVYQGSQRRTGCQFSFTCDGSLARRPSRMFWDRAQGVARAALGGYVHVPAGLATHYHTTQIYPYWAPSLRFLSVIGAHRFYRFKGAAGEPGTFRFAYRGGEPTAQLLKASESARESAQALDPAAIQRAWETGLAQARATSSALAPQTPVPGEADAPVRHFAAPTYSEAVRERGGDTLYKGDNLPEATGIKPEYRNSGRWIAQPGT